ncbi:GntR family transcriptional regulator [Nocardioides sp.]|uniref:GntR family transcriptional regulator n=1 Tax=Nocardioides sp. TaxID=35761 RepID=UPI003D0E8FB2
MTEAPSLGDSWPSAITGRVAAPLREQVVTSLRRAILDNHLKPGQRLVERELIERLGVSRTTVREALRQLTSEGLVTVLPQRGAIVTMPDAEVAGDLYEVRASLESLVVRKFVAKASDAQVRRLGAAVDAFAEVVDEPDVLHVLTVKDQFYSVLIEGAGSSVLQQLLETIQARVQLLRMTSLTQPGRPQQAVAELRRLLAAIEARDADAAAQACVEHVRIAAVHGSAVHQ